MTPTMSIPLSFRAAGATDLGTVRTNNEDAALMSASLVAIADGMGGHAAGEVAAAVVVGHLTTLAAGDGAITADALRHALERARGELRALSAADQSMAGMGTTLVALALTPDGVVLAHVGDSRLYRLRDGGLEQLTTDHTHVQRLVDAGRLDPDAVREHPFRSVILRSLDDTSDDLPDVERTEAIAAGDRLLLCSDGLSDYVPNDKIHGELAHGTPQEAADRLVRLALDEATRDNVTVVVVDAEMLDADDAGGGSGSGSGSARVLGATLDPAELSAPAHEVLAGLLRQAAAEPDDAAEPEDPASGPGDSASESDDAAEPGDPPEETSAVPQERDALPQHRDDSPPNRIAPAQGSTGAARRSGLWLGLVVLTFFLTTGIVWLTHA